MASISLANVAHLREQNENNNRLLNRKLVFLVMVVVLAGVAFIAIQIRRTIILKKRIRFELNEVRSAVETSNAVEI